MPDIRVRDVDQNTSDLIKDAAKRAGMEKIAFVRKQLEKVASREYAKQQEESSRC